jgi:predicted nucleotidyltransferase
MATIPVTLPRDEIEQFCRRNHIRKLSLFGSVLTDRFRPGSDIDVLVEFEPETKVGLFDVARIELELTEKLGRKVDLRTAGDLSRYFRDEVVATAAVQYERP